MTVRGMPQPPGVDPSGDQPEPRLDGKSIVVADSTLEARALRDALRSGFADRRGCCDWTVDQAGWVVTLYSPEDQAFFGRTLEEALAW